MDNCIRDDIVEYKTVMYYDREIKIFILGKKEVGGCSISTSEFEEKNENRLVAKMSRSGGE